MSTSNKSPAQGPSTRELLSEAEAMAATSKRSGKAPSTRQLVNDAERMLGRTPQSNAPFIVGVALVLAAVGVAVMLLV